MNKIEIRFLPENKSARVSKGASILEAAREASVEIESSCNGMGTCGKCLIQQVEGAVDEPHADEIRLIGRDSLARGVRLACRSKAKRRAAFTVAMDSEEAQAILPEGLMPAFDLEPGIRKVCLDLPGPTLEDASDDLSRIERALGLKFQNVHLSAMRQIPSVLRSAGFKATMILSSGTLIGLEPGNTSPLHFGVAIDIGTTTIVASLYDLSTGRELTACSMVNPQKRYGLDVLSRIQHVREHDKGLENLRISILDGINFLIGKACIVAGVQRENIYEMAVAANSTMMHLFLGVDPSGMGRSPYVSAFARGVSFSASALGIDISRFGEVYCLPSVSAYVGADIVAGILCTKLGTTNEKELFIDIGTNGEIVVSTGREIFACSCAAGPALEGMNISCGMRAAHGAVERVSIGNDVELRTIGGKPARGICGSGVIDAVGEMIKAGIISESGRYIKPELADSNGLAKRLRKEDGKIGFALSFDKNGTPAVILTQKDIRQVQLAKAAILSGMLALMDHLGLDFSDINRVYVAGAFGCRIRMENLVRIGVLPQQLLDRVIPAGNASKSGAALCLLSKRKRDEASSIARRIEYVELSCHSGFDKLFTRCLSFPKIP